MPHRPPSLPHLGGVTAVILFAIVLAAFVVESELAQYVQTTLEFRQPFFIFYVVHSSFAISFPLHVLYLRTTTKYTLSGLLSGLKLAITDHLAPKGVQPYTGTSFPYRKFITLVLTLTLGMTLPGLLWFAAVSLAPLSDVTAIWNTNPFFAYILTVKLYGLRWESRRLVGVVLATAGVMVVVYGGMKTEDGSGVTARSPRPSRALVGDVLTLLAALVQGLYQVMYKRYAALPNDPELQEDEDYERLSEEDPDTRSETSRIIPVPDDDIVHPPPFGLHPTFLTSLVGLATGTVLWIAFPILDYLDMEPFKLPPNSRVAFGIAGIALSGVVFNSGFMILLGVWGPVIASVGSLLTIVLVVISDALWGAGLEALTFWSICGSTIIVAAFGMLAYDVYQKSYAPSTTSHVHD
ncbi:uncharacterized protein SCHCODRAFT_02744507 [Schizophyllum commune H4-8]|uniref:EamA domain-containing protein n=1 Tax=Schizophyllum commune (strain H4-8 / FGSC 9210) TaxID=578458 RepID=D8PQ88_SCHCM|nr:uncharacterized protein SCHCODRAFT_02744507 [Schizophyllum commune H4-8]KAI5898240.1 hypothetical protein SCHCODRAFT_02744507 [Schizophyllum commune H4-8]